MWVNQSKAGSLSPSQPWGRCHLAKDRDGVRILCTHRLTVRMEFGQNQISTGK